MNNLRIRAVVIIVVVVIAIIIGRLVFSKKSPVVEMPRNYSEQIDGLNGTPTR